MSDYGDKLLTQDKLDARLLWISSSLVFSGAARA